MPTEFDQVVREISVSQGLVTTDQAQMAFAKLQELEAQGQVFPLSIVYERMQMIGNPDRLALENAARYRVTREIDKELARIIRESGYAEDGAVDQALSVQKDHYRASGETLRVSDWLVQQGYLNEAQRIAAEKIYQLGGQIQPPMP